MFLKVYKWFDMSLEVLYFVFQFKYLLQSRFVYFKPYHLMFNFLIRRKNMYEMKQDMQKSTGTVWETLKSNNIFILFLAVKFLQWKYSSDANI